VETEGDPCTQAADTLALAPLDLDGRTFDGSVYAAGNGNRHLPDTAHLTTPHSRSRHRDDGDVPHGPASDPGSWRPRPRRCRPGHAAAPRRPGRRGDPDGTRGADRGWPGGDARRTGARAPASSTGPRP